MNLGRNLEDMTTEELRFWAKAYKVGMTNPWCSGRAAKEDGDYIVKEDRLNRGSVCAIDDVEELKKFFRHGNWCLGQAVIYKKISFIQQVDGGDEWLTMKLFSDGTVRVIDSITFEPMCRDYQGEYDYMYLPIEERVEGKAGQPKRHTHRFQEFIQELLDAQIVNSRYSKKEIVRYGWGLEDYRRGQ